MKYYFVYFLYIEIKKLVKLGYNGFNKFTVIMNKFIELFGPQLLVYYINLHSFNKFTIIETHSDGTVVFVIDEFGCISLVNTFLH